MRLARSPPLTRRKGVQVHDAPSSPSKASDSNRRGAQQCTVIRKKQDKAGKMRETGKSIFNNDSCSEEEGKRGTVEVPTPQPEPTDGPNQHKPDERLEIPTDSTRNTRSFEVGKLGASAYRPFGSDIGSDSTCCRGGPGQVVCGNPVEDGQSGVQCEKCTNWFHSACQLIPPAAVTALERFKVLSWFCAECKTTLTKQPKASEKISQLELKVAGLDISLREHMKVAHASLKELESLATQQTAFTKKLYQEQEKAKATYAEIARGTCAEVVASVQKGPTYQQAIQAPTMGTQAAQEISGMIDNFIDKERRKLNVVVHNLPEQETTNDPVDEKMQKDITSFCKIIKDELRLNIRVNKAFRAGPKQSTRPRLLIVTLDSTDAKLELLKLSPQLRNSDQWRSLFINPDLTRKEREDGKKLRQELADRKGAGESNIYIRQGKIVKGPPQARRGSLGPQDPRQSTTAPLSSGSASDATGQTVSTVDTSRSESLKEGNGKGVDQPIDREQPSRQF